MSNFHYCTCGFRTPNNLNPVNFCAGCGNPFNKFIPNKPATTIKANKKPVTLPLPEEPEDDDLEIEEGGEDFDTEEDDRSINKMPEIDLTDNPFVLDETRPNEVKISSLVGTSKKVIPVDKINIREKPPKLSKKEFLKQWANEAGSSRKNK